MCRAKSHSLHCNQTITLHTNVTLSPRTKINTYDLWLIWLMFFLFDLIYNVLHTKIDCSWLINANESICLVKKGNFPILYKGLGIKKHPWKIKLYIKNWSTCEHEILQKYSSIILRYDLKILLGNINNFWSYKIFWKIWKKGHNEALYEILALFFMKKHK